MTLLAALIIAGLTVLVGALVQSSAGLGLGLIAAPVVTILDPALMPGSMLVATTFLPVLTLAREAPHADWPGVSWALAGRLAGTAAGVWVIATVPSRTMGFVVAGVVFAAVIVSLATSVPRNRWTLVAAGLISGTTATSTSIGGPPMALLYQREAGPRVRASMSVFFLAGNLFALGGLAVAGRLPGRVLVAGLIFSLCSAVGFVTAGRLRRLLDGGNSRAAVLVLASGAAVILVIRSALN
jgi:hypothetical protein